MYADLVAEGRKRSVKDRLNGGSADEPRRTMLPDAKRQRHSEGTLRYNTSNDFGPSTSTKVDAKDLRQKLQRKVIEPGTVSASYIHDKLSGTMHQQPVKSAKLSGSVLQQGVKSEKLSGPMLQRPANSQLIKSKGATESGRPLQEGVPLLKETLHATEKVNFPVASNKNSQKKSELSVDSLLQSLGLEKYSITFKAEEVDMTALKHMTDEDLKTIGLPMGPRKKILLALKSKT